MVITLYSFSCEELRRTLQANKPERPCCYLHQQAAVTLKAQPLIWVPKCELKDTILGPYAKAQTPCIFSVHINTRCLFKVTQ